MTLPEGLARILDGVRRRDLMVRLAEYPVLLLTMIPIFWMLQATADRWLELSWGVRAVLLAMIVRLIVSAVPW